MKTITNRIVLLVFSLVFVMSLASCNTEGDRDVWADAVYTEDTELGSGSKTLTLEVKVNEHLITLTVKTDKSTVGEALTEQGIITGEQGDYGIYIKAVNGITADFDKTQTYWAFYVNGEYAMSGADTTEITEGAVYRLEYSR